MFKKFLGSAAIVAALAAVQPAKAIDIMPGDYTVFPKGTNMFLLYGQYSHASKLKIDAPGPAIPGSDLGVAIGIARVLHYNEIAGIPVGVQAFIPFGGFTSARIGGQKQRTQDGLGDLTMGATIWPVNIPGPTGTTIGLTAYVTAPTGNYSARPGTVSLGSGTWAFTPQLGIIQGLGNGFFLDLAADVAIRDDHREFGLTIRRDPSYQAQAYLRYQFSPTTNVSFGYSGTYGGKDFVGGTYARTKTRQDQIRVFASTFLTKTTQIQAMVGTDVSAQAGFKQDVVGTIRLLQLF